MHKINISIIGASMRSEMLFRFLEKYPEQGVIKGVYDIVPKRAEYLINRYKSAGIAVFHSLAEAIDGNQIDAVFIGTPDYLHTEPVIAAMGAGKHVYCEKPLATTMEDCDEMVQAALKSKSIFYVGKNLRHGPVHKKLHELLDSGKLGKLLTIEANEYYYGGRTYFRRWNRRVKYSGGLWITKACHDFDLLNWFAAGNPKKVFATSNLSYYKPIQGAGPNCRVCAIKETCPDFYDINAPEKSGWLRQWDEMAAISEEATGQPQDLCLYNSDKDTFDNGMAMIEFDNDIRATYTVNVVSARTTRQMRLMGTEGSAEGDMETGMVKFWKRYSKHTEQFDLTDQMDSGHGGADDKILMDFFDCCRTGRIPQSGWQEGRRAMELGLAARKSCETGNVVLL